MGVNSVNGQDLAALFTASTARAPVPRPRTAEDTASSALVSEEQKQSAARVQGQNITVPDSGSRLRVDSESQRIVTQILNDNNEVVRQIPLEELLQIAARFRRLQGVLFDERA